MSISIKPSHVGLLHRAMGVPKNKKISISDLMNKKVRDMAKQNAPAVKQDTFALNARKFNHA